MWWAQAFTHNMEGRANNLVEEASMEFLQFMNRTKEALNEYVSLTDPDLEGSLMSMGDWAARIIPECVGLSLTLFDPDLTFALVAPTLDPAEKAAAPEAGHQTGSDTDNASVAPRLGAERGRGSTKAASEPLDEERWAVMARDSCALGVASSLSMPVLDEGRVVGGINVYASSPDAFSGHHDELAAALGASADGAVTNADLGFESRRRAEEAPRKLREEQVLDVGVGILAARLGLGLDPARRRLHDSAEQAGVTATQAALVVINALRQ